MIKRDFFILIGIILIGVVLRFYQLGSIPPSLNWDEVSLGYNSYSILQTGRDEYGTFFPLTIRSFGDYKQPGYVYLSLVPLLLFDLTPFAVRFASAFFGSLSILLVYFLVLEIFAHSARRRSLAIFSTGIFALSPWSIQFSRFASEANVGLGLMLLGVWLFLKGVRTDQRLVFFLSGISMTLSMYTYHSQKIFTPFLLLLMILVNYKFFLERKKLVGIFLTFFIVLNSFWLFDTATTARGRSVLLTSQQTELLKTPLHLAEFDRSENNPFFALLHNRRIVYISTYFESYLSHFDPNFLFVKGDNARHHAPDMGVLYLIALPFIILGLLALWKDDKKIAFFVSLWLLGAPATSALAIDAPSAIRSMMFLPIWDIAAAYGLLYSYSLLQKPLVKNIFIVSVSSLFILNAMYFFHQYFIHTNKEYAPYWQYGYKEAVSKSHSVSPAPVIFDKSIEQAYAFYLFYSKVSPQDYLDKGGSNQKTRSCYHINNAYFGECLEGIRDGYIVTAGDPPDSISLENKMVISYPDGKDALGIYQYFLK